MLRWLREDRLAAELSVEFAGTMILVLFGCGSVAQVLAGGLGGHDSIAWAWGFGVTFGVYVAGRISGGHLNPAVSVAFAMFSGFEWRKVLPYSLAQTLGAFIGALLVRWNYGSMLHAVDPRHTVKTQIVFSTLPGNGTLPVDVRNAFLDQIIGTAILLFLILAVTDVLNVAPRANLTALIVGLIVVAIGMAWGSAAGYAINPARDFGPRVASFFTGYGGAFVDQTGYPYFWVPIVAPVIGGVIGAGAYRLAVSRYLPIDQREPGRVDQTSG
ncbi:MIP/aquaporin family protein [Dactylosporangium salmoneum]|uniref:MIP/aquaporin family protein n=1 Tax=Dactylosporangium salmoneum TaxID=53361 RepID=UPI003CD09939